VQRKSHDSVMRAHNWKIREKGKSVRCSWMACTPAAPMERDGENNYPAQDAVDDDPMAQLPGHSTTYL
jgi:hypothetical protein